MRQPNWPEHGWGNGLELGLLRTGLDSGQKRVIGEMAVPHRRLVIGMAQDPAYGEQVHPGIDHEGGSRVPQIMNSQVVQARRISCRLPWMLQVRERLTRFRIWKDIAALIEPRHNVEDVDRRLR